MEFPVGLTKERFLKILQKSPAIQNYMKTSNMENNMETLSKEVVSNGLYLLKSSLACDPAEDVLATPEALHHILFQLPGMPFYKTFIVSKLVTNLFEAICQGEKASEDGKKLREIWNPDKNVVQQNVAVFTEYFLQHREAFSNLDTEFLKVVFSGVILFGDEETRRKLASLWSPQMELKFPPKILEKNQNKIYKFVEWSFEDRLKNARTIKDVQSLISTHPYCIHAKLNLLEQSWNSEDKKIGHSWVFKVVLEKSHGSQREKVDKLVSLLKRLSADKLSQNVQEKITCSIKFMEDNWLMTNQLLVQKNNLLTKLIFRFAEPSTRFKLVFDPKFNTFSSIDMKVDALKNMFVRSTPDPTQIEMILDKFRSTVTKHANTIVSSWMSDNSQKSQGINLLMNHMWLLGYLDSTTRRIALRSTLDLHKDDRDFIKELRDSFGNKKDDFDSVLIPWTIETESVAGAILVLEKLASDYTTDSQKLRFIVINAGAMDSQKMKVNLEEMSRRKNFAELIKLWTESVSEFSELAASVLVQDHLDEVKTFSDNVKRTILVSSFKKAVKSQDEFKNLFQSLKEKLRQDEFIEVVRTAINQDPMGHSVAYNIFTTPELLDEIKGQEGFDQITDLALKHIAIKWTTARSVPLEWSQLQDSELKKAVLSHALRLQSEKLEHSEEEKPLADLLNSFRQLKNDLVDVKQSVVQWMESPDFSDRAAYVLVSNTAFVDTLEPKVKINILKRALSVQQLDEDELVKLIARIGLNENLPKVKDIVISQAIKDRIVTYSVALKLALNDIFMEAIEKNTRIEIFDVIFTAEPRDESLIGRLISHLKQSKGLENVKNDLFHKAIERGVITPDLADSRLAFDETLLGSLNREVKIAIEDLALTAMRTDEMRRLHFILHIGKSASFADSKNIIIKKALGNRNINPSMAKKLIMHGEFISTVDNDVKSLLCDVALAGLPNAKEKKNFFIEVAQNADVEFFNFIVEKALEGIIINSALAFQLWTNPEITTLLNEDVLQILGATAQSLHGTKPGHPLEEDVD